jgi:hypothetical protein
MFDLPDAYNLNDPNANRLSLPSTFDMMENDILVYCKQAIAISMAEASPPEPRE